MNIKQLEQELSMTRANIRFYEQEGLIAPARAENKYRDYSSAEIETLQKIKLLRTLGVSIDEIKALQSNTEQLSVTLTRKIKQLEQKQQEAQRAKSICHAIKDDNATYQTLNAQKYWQLESRMTELSAPEPLSDGEAQAFYPWRRFFARTLDLSLYELIAVLALEFIFNVNTIRLFTEAALLLGAVPLLLMLVLEPLLLMLFGTSLGKLIMGLRLESRDSVRISYSQGISRCFKVLLNGMGLGIPLYNIYRLWKSYRTCADNEHLSWDYDFYYTVKDVKPKRSAILAAAMLIIFALNICASAAPRLPQNRGEINVAQFAENYNKYASYYLGYDYSYEMNESGQLDKKINEDSFVIDVSQAPLPVFEYTLDENGNIDGLSFSAEKRGGEGFGAAYSNEMVLSALSLAGAQKSVNIFTPYINIIINTIQEKPFESYAFTVDNAEISCNFNYSGYILAPPFLVTEENSEDAFYMINFQIKL